MTKLTGAAAMALMPFQAVLIDSLALRKAPGMLSTVVFSFAKTLSRTHRHGAARSSFRAEKLELTLSFMLVNQPGMFPTQVLMGWNTLVLIQIQAVLRAVLMPSQTPLMVRPALDIEVATDVIHLITGTSTDVISHVSTAPSTLTIGTSSEAMILTTGEITGSS